MLRKNTASQFIHFAAVNATTGAALSGASFSTTRRCLDGTFADATGSITEDTGLGFYKFALSQADTNGNNCAYFFTATNMVPVTINVVTTVLDPTSTAFGLSIAKTTNITGFNDIAATAIVSSGAITTSGGAVSTVTTATNVTTVNGLAAGVVTAASIAASALDNKGNWNVGKTGYSLTATTGLGNQTADITGTITTATNVTNVNGIAANVITAAAIADGAIDNATFAADVGSTAIATNVIGIAAKKGVVDALNVDTYAEPGQEAPAATNTLVKKIGYLYKAWRNKTTQTATTYSLYADDTTTVDQKATVSDDATTFTRTEIATGP